MCAKRQEANVWFQLDGEGAAAESAKPGIKQKAVANKRLKPKKGWNSKINERLIDSIRLDSAQLLGFVRLSEGDRNVLVPRSG